MGHCAKLLESESLPSVRQEHEQWKGFYYQNFPIICCEWFHFYLLTGGHMGTGFKKHLAKVTPKYLTPYFLYKTSIFISTRKLTSPSLYVFTTWNTHHPEDIR